MKKLIFCLTIAAFASVASLQAGEGKECAAACAKTTKVAAAECSKSAKAGECSKSASACSSKKANATAKGATQLMAKR